MHRKILSYIVAFFAHFLLAQHFFGHSIRCGLCRFVSLAVLPALANAEISRQHGRFLHPTKWSTEPILRHHLPPGADSTLWWHRSASQQITIPIAEHKWIRVLQQFVNFASTSVLNICKHLTFFHFRLQDTDVLGPPPLPPFGAVPMPKPYGTSGREVPPDWPGFGASTSMIGPNEPPPSYEQATANQTGLNS